ncbi:MAG: hypothetical protein AAF206_16000 [Bacteroidota bacterium]
MFAVSQDKLYWTYDGWNNSIFDVDVTAALLGQGQSAQLTDVEFVPGDYFTVYMGGKGLFHYEVSSGLLSDRTASLSQFQAATTGIYSVLLDAPDPTGQSSDNLYVLYHWLDPQATPPISCTADVHHDIDITDGASSHMNWTLQASPSNARGAVFEVSLADESVMYTESCGRTMAKSTDSGVSFSNINFYNNTFNGTWTHADVRSMVLVSGNIGGFNDVLYVGNDGGILFSDTSPNALQPTWQNINGTGLNNTQFYGFGGLESDPGLLTGGTQDNGAFMYNQGNWTNQIIGDGYEAVIANDQYMYCQSQSVVWKKLNASTSWGYSSIVSSSTATGDPTLYSRPMELDANGDMLYAIRDELYKYTNIGTASPETLEWITDFNATFGVINTSFSAVHPAPSNPDTVYVAFRQPTWDNSATTHEDRFFKTTNATSGSPTWTDITDNVEQSLPGVMVWKGISCITVDPDDPNKVWVGINRFWEDPNMPGSGIKRVLYSCDGGNTWIDYSEGLPIFPTNQIKYQTGSNDMLYLATDVGVFYRDASMPQWECFSTDLPVCIVSDLEINHCDQKLRASLYGRGIWESPLAPGTGQVISSNTTWTGSVDMYTDLCVNPGVTLTITGTLNMAKGKRIEVKRGATLRVNGGTITNACGRMWRGIDVWGTRNASQLTAGAQGKVILENGALIEHARDAITTIRTLPSGNWDWDHTGGIIQASNSTFRNNRRAIQYLSYASQLPTGNLGYFENCVFETTRTLNDPNTLPSAFFTNWRVDGVKLRGNTFRNTTPLSVMSEFERGTGIHSIDARYVVDGLCTLTLPQGTPCPANNLIRSSFEGLRYGVDAMATNPLNAIAVKHSDFNNGTVAGIRLRGMRFAAVTESAFDVSGFAAPTNNGFVYGYGLFLDECSEYHVEANNFMTTQNGIAGIVAEDSRDPHTEIYNNEFHDLLAAILAQNDNDGPTQPDGLRIRCNDFHNSLAHDIAVIPDANPLTDIGFIQGQNTGDPVDLVGNRYFDPCNSSTAEHNYYVAKNSFLSNPQAILHWNNIDAVTVPQCRDQLVNSLSTNFTFVKDDQCPSRLSQGGSNNIANKISLEQSGIISLEAQIDGGDTDAILNLINAGGSDEDVLSALSDASPYLSDAVLIAAVEHFPALPEIEMASILMSNSPLSETVLSAVSDMNSSLPDDLMEALNLAQEGVSERSLLEARFRQQSMKLPFWKVNY